jgi:hypothetical protein
MKQIVVESMESTSAEHMKMYTTLLGMPKYFSNEYSNSNKRTETAAPAASIRNIFCRFSFFFFYYIVFPPVYRYQSKTEILV